MNNVLSTISAIQKIDSESRNEKAIAEALLGWLR